MSEALAQFLVTFLVLTTISFAAIGILAVWNGWNRWLDKRAARKKEDGDLW